MLTAGSWRILQITVSFGKNLKFSIPLYKRNSKEVFAFSQVTNVNKVIVFAIRFVFLI